MPRQVEVSKVFIASPGGLDGERAVVRSEVASFNESLMLDFDVAFCCYGFESVPGGAGRPQALINEAAEVCDYMVLILSDRWGSQPAEDEKFSSGTEEEYHLAKSCIANPDKAMRDILVLFKGVAEAQLRDPGPQLKAVLNFKAELEASRTFLYKTFDSDEDFRQEVFRKLLRWARGGPAAAAGQSAPPDVPPVPSGATPLERAQSFEANGQMTQAEAAYAAAIVDDDIEALTSYARYLRRTGRGTRSIEINNRILSTLGDGAAAPTADQRARVLTNIGVVYRKQGQLLDSVYELQEAVNTATEAGAEGREALAYALDNLGISHQRLGEVQQAEESFLRALETRAANDEVGRAKTLSNLGRLHRRRGDLDEALSACTGAIALLQSGDAQGALAGAMAARGEVYEAIGEADAAESDYRAALALNQALGVPDNVAMSFAQLGRLLLERGDYAEAEQCAQRSLDENMRVSNREGTVGAMHLLARVLGRTERYAESIGLFEKSLAEYRTMGNQAGEAWARLHLAETLRAAGDDTESTVQIRAARLVAEGTGNVRLIDEVSSWIS